MSTPSLDLERKYQVDGQPGLLPYSLAKKKTVYPTLCISPWHMTGQAPRTAGRNSHLCPDCTDVLRASWHAIANHYQTLTDALHPSQSFSNGDRVSGTGGIYPPLPINGDISDLLRDLSNSVWSVVQCLIEDRPDWRMPADPTVDVLADNLARWHVDYIAGHPRAAHTLTVLQETHILAGAVRAQASEVGPAEHDLGQDCRKTTPNPEDPTYPDIPCPGKIIAVQQANGTRQAQCTADPTHTVPLAVWTQVAAQRATHRAGIAPHLLKRYRG